MRDTTDKPLSAFVQEMQAALERKDYAALQHIMMAHLRPSRQQAEARDWQRYAAGEAEEDCK